VSGTAPSPSDRRPDIQGLRAIAVGVVVAFHAGLPVPGGFIGVDVFFVISGFVITGMLAREWAKSGTLRLRTFYARRFRRLTPALALLVGVVFVISALVQSPMGAQQTTAQTGIGALLLTANIVIANTTGGYFDAPAATNPLLNTWSLSVEEQFYLMFPLLLLLSWRAARRFRDGPAVPILVIGGVGVLSLVLAIVEASGHRIPLLPHSLIGFYGPLTRVWEFAVGALLSVLAARLTPMMRPWLGTVLAALGLLAVGASLWLVDGNTVWPGPLTLLPVAGTLALLAAGLVANPLSRALSMRPFVVVGDISYSWYLWHWPLIVFALLLWPEVPSIALIAAIVSLLPTAISYRYVEQPIRGLRNIGIPRMVRIVTLTLVPPMAVGLALIVSANNGFWIPSVQKFVADASPMHAGNAAGCNKSINPAKRDPERCRWNTDATGAPVYLVGDSHADHLSEALIEASGTLARPLTVATGNSCAFYDIHLVNSAERRSPCNTFVKGTTEWLLEQPAGTVVIGTSSIYWRSNTFAAGPDASSATRVRAEKDAYLEAGLLSTVQQLQKAGHAVVLVQDVPYFASPYSSDPQQFSVRDIASGTNLAVHMPQDLADANQRAMRDALVRVGEQTGATVVDLRDYFCPDATCTTQLDDLYLYRDDGHISIGASRALGPLFTSALTAAPRPTS
jgi:peptidoglycan/LPS O-acetylase OafA/YrhL